MVLVIASFIIAIFSILMALRSLKQLKHVEKIDEVKDELKKGKVVFQKDSSSGSSSVSEDRS